MLGIAIWSDFFVEIFNRNTENTKIANFFCWKKRYYADVILNIRVNQALRWRDQRKSTHGLIGDGFNRDGRPGEHLLKKSLTFFEFLLYFLKYLVWIQVDWTNEKSVRKGERRILCLLAFTVKSINKNLGEKNLKIAFL